jgi:ketosteroid isomerase-like protein
LTIIETYVTVKKTIKREGKMKSKARFILASVCVLLAFCTLFFGCSRSREAEQRAARNAMISLMDTLLQAVNAHNVDKILELCDRSPEFFAFLDGEAFDYEGFVKGIREEFRAFRQVHTLWDTLHVKVLGSDVAVALAPFHQVLTDTSGVETRLTGDVTWVAHRVDGKWKLIYAHAVHRPDTSRR